MLVALLAGCGSDEPASVSAPSEKRTIIAAATTALEDTGLMPALLERFHAETGWRVKALSVPSGEALGLIGRGAADVAVTNAPIEEEHAIGTGLVCCRTLVMTNDFVIVGPPGTKAFAPDATPPEAMREIVARRALFLSRGDGSGTNEFELGLWEQAGTEPAGAQYLESGQGMGATLRIASEKAALTISDRGTYFAEREHLDLDIVYASPEEMPAPYSVLRATPEAGRRINAEGAEAFATWLLEPSTQEFIGAFRIDGQPLFKPAI